MRRAALLLFLLLAACTREPEKLVATPDHSQPAVAIVAPQAPQQVRPQQVVLVPTPTPVAPQDALPPDVPPAVARAGEEMVAAYRELRANSAEELYLRGYMVRERDPGEAMRRFKEAAQLDPTNAVLQGKVAAQLAALAPRTTKQAEEDFALGVKLKAARPADAAALFFNVMELTTEGSPLHQKAAAARAALSP